MARVSESASGKSDFSALSRAAQAEPGEAMSALSTSESGLTKHESRLRLVEYGHNTTASEEKKSGLKIAIGIIADPLIAIMLLMAIVSFLTGQLITFLIILGMVLISAVLNYIQESKADSAVEKLKAMVQTTVTVIREGAEKDMPIKFLVPGDIVKLSAGDIVPADLRLIRSKDLFVNQAALTGESMPVEKHAPKESKPELLEYESLCFMGTSVESGTALALVVLSGKSTYFASIAQSMEKNVETGFEKGVKDFTWLMIRLILLMAPLVLFINGIKNGDWFQAFLFALSVVVGLTPELLPMMITVNLSNGAVRMSEKKVIVKRLNAIQNLGAMDILCTDKTGTLTQGKVILEKHIDSLGNESQRVLQHAFLNSFYQTGLKNIMDMAILRHEGVKEALELEKEYVKIDEVAFDFVRRRMSVVVGNRGTHSIICKGAVEEMLSICDKAESGGKTFPLSAIRLKKMKELVNSLNSDGFRVIAIASREISQKKKAYSARDERGLTLIGFAAFLDPPKDSAARALSELHRYGISVKVLTGDNELVTRKVCRDVGMPVRGVLLGADVEKMSEAELGEAAERTDIFAKLSPSHKERIVSALRKRGHSVGFMGDGINDAPALKASDVGISVESAADIAKESSSIVLMERSLLVIKDGVAEGRRVFGNIDKYIRMAASSNFGNMFSVIGASIFLPFLPMLPLQVLVNNLLYDLSQATIPSDNVDKEWIEKPRKWSVESIKKFIIYMGPVSSLFDFTTFFILIFMFNALADPALFRTGWFVESLLTQTLIIHIIRTNKIPFLQSTASARLVASSIIISIVGVALPFSPIAPYLGLVPLPPAFLIVLAATLLAYFALAHILKGRIFRTSEAAGSKSMAAPAPAGVQ